MDARKAHKASSSSSPSSSSKRWKYQVFLSFRGEDTRKGFTGHLHAAFSDAGISAFLDDNQLEKAEFIKPQLEQAIDGSMISIIVFSKRYAESSWCLDELVKIMECRERLGQQVIPLFYNVEASDVRQQTGSFEQAFEKHEAGKHEKEKVQRWRNALSQAADLCGEDLKNADNGHEAKFINKILGVVNKQLYSKYRLDIKHPVGITSRVKALSNHLDIENSGSKDDVRMIGIWGMGGIGKTTLAKAIYNEFEGSFEGRSFLANVREVIANQPMGLVRLQKQLLNDILKSKGPKKVDSVLKGIEMIRKRLPCKRALVIIDDADDLHQLEAIAGAHDWFGLGSRIVITTRNQHLLEQVGVDSTYIAEKMDEEEALEFFSWHAFKRGYPDQEYLDLSKRVIRYCQGLPLALRVVGSFLIKRSIAEWESHLEKLQRSPDGDIQKILRISYDGLPDHTTRKIFLDISCFFIGMDKDYVTQILDGCKFSAVIGVSVLNERCLVTVSEQNKLMMHDLLRDMGREIIRKKAHGHPEKFSRLWKREDVTDVLSDESGTEEIEGGALDLHRGYFRGLDPDLTRFSAQAFTNMKKLRLLHLSGVELTGEYKDFPKKLVWLSWHFFPLESIPDDFPMQPKLVALDLQDSKLKIVWKDCKLHQNLKILNLSYSYELTKSPDFSKLPNLEELILQYCVSLSEVHSSIGDLGRLSLVNLKGCIKLRVLPLNFYKSKSIETLLLNGCRSFEKLADGLGDMVSLITLKADVTAIRQIPSSILKLKKLKVLSLCGVEGSPSTNLLPPSLQSLSSLRALALAGWSLTDDAFPKDLGSLISSENLDLAGNDFCSLPSLSRLSKLHDLSLNKCENLRAIPDLPTNLKVLNADGCIRLEKMPDFSEMSNIRELYLRDSGKLTEIPGLDKSLNSMTRIYMDGCTNLTADFRKNILQHKNVLSLVNLQFCKMLKDLPLNFYKSKSIETLLLNDCHCFEKLDEGLGDMVSLTTLKADYTAMRQIPSSIFKLKKLKVLSLCHGEGSPSTSWSFTDDAFPKDLGSLISLVHLNLDGNDYCSLPSLSRLSQLQDLSLNKCKKLRAIPDLPTNLKVLRADGCIALEKMPDFSEMSNIRELHLSDSGKLTKIPGLDKSLNSMTTISMDGCTNLTTDFRKKILRGWTSCGYGGIFLSGNDIPDWFHYVHDDDIVYFTVPQSVGRILKGLTLSFVLSSDSFSPSDLMFRSRTTSFSISIKNMTEGTELDARITPDFIYPIEGYYLWQGQLSNDELKLQDGDKVLIEIITSCQVKKTGVSLEWDKFMNENMIDYHLCAYEQRPSQNLVNDDDIIHVEDDDHMTKSTDFSKFPNLEKLILKGCKRLYKVHSSIGDLGRLSLVNLEGCISLWDLPLNFYKSKSIETLILNGCSGFQKLADGLGDMVSLTILEADNTAIRQIPSSIVKLKNLRILSLSCVKGSPWLKLLPASLHGLNSLIELCLAGCRLTEDAIPEDLCSLISLEHLLLGGNDFHSLPSLAGFSKLKVLCLNACRKLRAIPVLPTNLYVLKANDCPELETIPDFSKMWNMRELYLSDSFKLTEVPGLDKSLNSMTRIHMEGCTNLTADFRNNILQRWTSCGFGGIYLNGIYDIPEWFKIADYIVFVEVPQRIMGRDLKGLTICFVYSTDRRKLKDVEVPICIIVRNLTKRTALHTKIAFGSYRSPDDHYRWQRQLSNGPEDHYLWQGQLSNGPEDHYLWQGQLSNDVLRLEGGDRISIFVMPDVDFVRVKTGVHLEWDKVMKENMDTPDRHLYDWETNGDF